MMAAITKATVATGIQEMERSQGIKRIIFSSCLLEEPPRAEVVFFSARSGS